MPPPVLPTTQSVTANAAGVVNARILNSGDAADFTLEANPGSVPNWLGVSADGVDAILAGTHGVPIPGDDSYWETGIEFAFRFEEAAGNPRVSTYESASAPGTTDSATEVGGDVAQGTGVSGFGAELLHANGRHLSIADRAGNRLGNRDWTLDGWLSSADTQDYGGIVKKGTDLDINFQASILHFTLHDGDVDLPFDLDNSTGLRHWRVSYNATTNLVTVDLDGFTTQTATLDWTDPASTDAWKLGQGGLFGDAADVVLDELCLWTKAMTAGRSAIRAAGKYIASFASDPPSVSTERTWIQVERGQAVSFTPTNNGGTGTWMKVSGTYPTGINAINATTGEVAGTPTVAAASTTLVFRCTNADGTSDWTVDLTIVQLYGVGHFLFAPKERVEATRNLVVVAGKANDPVANVSFVIDGGSPVVVTTPTFDARTKRLGYCVEIDPSLYSDGLHDIAPTVNYTDGDAYALGAREFATDDGDTITTARKRYVDHASGNDTTGDGTSGAPFLTVGKAMAHIQAAEGDCGGCTIYIKGMGDFVGGSPGTVTNNDGTIRIELWPGEASLSAGFDSSSVNPRATSLVIELVGAIKVDQIDLNANVADTPAFIARGPVTFQGKWTSTTGGDPGRVDDSLAFVSYGTWTGGIWLIGDGCNVGSEATNWVTVRDQANAINYERLVLNVRKINIGKQAFTSAGGGCCEGLLVDNMNAEGIAGPPHNDLVQLDGTGGRLNVWVNGIVGTNCRVSTLFHRGSSNEFVPSTDFVFKNVRCHPDALGGGMTFNTQRPTMGWKIAHVTMPGGALTCVHNFEDFGDRVTRNSHWEVKNCVAYGLVLTDLGWQTGSAACDHIAIADCATLGGAVDARNVGAVATSEAAAFNLATTYDYTVLNGGTLDGVADRLAGTLYDAVGHVRSNPTAIGAYAEAGET